MSATLRVGSRAAGAATAKVMTEAELVADVTARLEAIAPIALPALQHHDASRNDAGSTAAVATAARRGNDDDDANGGAAGGNSAAAAAELQRSRVKTAHALLLVCLNVGNEPPDTVRIEPCARLECWLDPVAGQGVFTSKGSESIADALEGQYRALQKDAVYKKVVDATIDDARQQMIALRRRAKDGRVLLHYNGHGMPRATHHGEIWFFDKDRTHYMPMNIAEIAKTLDSPAIIVLDCNGAGAVQQHWIRTNMMAQRPRDMLICACGDTESLPMNPLLPADMLTACLTTPVRMALEWYVSYSHRRTLLPSVTEDLIRRIPGDLADRKTPLGELNWIFTAVTDTIAWCTTPPAQFAALFRQDVLVKALFRNVLLAEKLLREVGCTPVTLPALPETTHSHPMWDVWEVALENIVAELPYMLTADLEPNPAYVYRPSSFFADQLTAFAVWIEAGDTRELPEQLPCAILGLTQISTRVRSLVLIARYLEVAGAVAVTNAVTCGVLVYITKLLINTPEVFLLATQLWMHIAHADPATASAELLRNQAERALIRHLLVDPDRAALLMFAPNDDGSSATAAAAVAAAGGAATAGPGAATAAASSPMATGGAAAGGFDATGAQLPSAVAADAGANAAAAQQAPVPTFVALPSMSVERCKAQCCYLLCTLLEHGGERAHLACWNAQALRAVYPLLASRDAQLRSWGALTLGRLFSGMRAAKEVACREHVSRIGLFSNLLRDRSPVVRSSGVTLLAALLGTRVDYIDDEALQVRRMQADRSVMINLRGCLHEPSSAVREELAIAAAQVLLFYAPLVAATSSASASAAASRPAVPLATLLNPDAILAHAGREWKLFEAGVAIKSALSASRPTDNARFDDEGAMFTVSLLSRDDPPPPAAWEDARVAPPAAEIAAGIVHDASVMLATLFYSCDAGTVRALLPKIAAGERPVSRRVAAEAAHSVRWQWAVVENAESVGTASVGGGEGAAAPATVLPLSEADRARNSRNNDLMRQLVLDVQERRFDPPAAAAPAAAGATAAGAKPGGAAGSVATSAGSPLTPAGGGADGAAGAGGLKQYTTVVHAFPAAQAHEPVVASALRALEPHALLAERGGRISVVDYETQQVLQQVQHASGGGYDGQLQALLVVNDIAEDAGFLVASRQGVFTLYHGLRSSAVGSGGGGGAAAASSGGLAVAATFAACPPPASGSGGIDLRCAYRPRDGVLFYGGATGSSSAGSGVLHHVTLLSLAEEQVIQALPMPGEAAVTALFAHPNARSAFVGFSDGVVRYLDDRTKSGQIAGVSLLLRRGPTAATDTIVGVGVSDTDATRSMVFASTATTLRVFDIRQPAAPVKLVELAGAAAAGRPLGGSTSSFGPSGAGSAASGGSGAHLSSPTVPPGAGGAAQTVAGFSVAMTTGLMSVALSDGTCDLYNARGQSILPKPFKFAHSSVTVVHPIRPLALYGADLVFL